jgi:hypothetical protein
LLAAVWVAACTSGSDAPPGGGSGGGGTAAVSGTGAAGTPMSGTGGITAGTGATGGTTAGTGGTTAGTGGTTAGTGGITAGTGGDTGGTGGVTGDDKCRDTAEGVYAMKTEIPVWWQDLENPSAPLVDPGRGKIIIYMRGEISDIGDDMTGSGVIHPCGTEMPVFLVDATCAAIQIELPNEMWESTSMPDYVTTGSTTGFNPGDVLSIAKTTGLVGLDLLEPDGTFPEVNTDVRCTLCPDGGACLADCFPDHDNDSKAGVTVTIKEGGTVSNAPYTCGNPLTPQFTFKAAPLDIISGAFPAASGTANKFYVGLRTRMGGSGVIADDCQSGAGSAEADDILNRIYACARPDGNDCTPEQVAFIDLNTPKYHVLQAGETPPASWTHSRAEADAALDRTPSAGPQSSVVRLGDLGTAITCQQVREAAYPAFPQ